MAYNIEPVVQAENQLILDMGHSKQTIIAKMCLGPFWSLAKDKARKTHQCFNKFLITSPALLRIFFDAITGK